MVQAGTYSAVRHYLEAIEAAGTADGRVVASKIKELPVDDFFAKGRVRDDGRMMHDMYLVEVEATERIQGRMGLL
jgi:branched-chain amino acid transport system substrate-binding protein